MRCLGWFVVCAIFIVLLEVDRSGAFPGGCLRCTKNKGYPPEKCCDDCPACQYNFDVEAPKDPGCRKITRYSYDIEKVTGCNKETYDRLDAAVEVLPQKGCKKSYKYHYDVDKPCDCYEETYDTHDFEVISPKKETKCKKVKLEAYADHPVRNCQCDCYQRRRYVEGILNISATQSNTSSKSVSEEFDDTERNRIRRVKRQVGNCFNVNLGNDNVKTGWRPNRPNGFRRFAAGGPRMKRREKQGFRTTQGGFVCHCMPADQSQSHGDDEPGKDYGDLVGASRKTAPIREPAVYIGDSSNPITYDQIKKHMDALPKSEYSPTTNDIIGNLTVLFYDIYQQKHKKNFTLPLKYGTRTVVEKGDGLQQYDIKPIEGEYRPPMLNRIASKGIHFMGRKIDRKTGQDGPRRNRIQKGP